MSKIKCCLALFATNLLFLLGCSSSLELSGNYSSGKSPYLFALNKDFTFDYEYKFQFLYQHSHGIWSRVSKNKIVLNSSIQDRSLTLKTWQLDSDKLDISNLFLIKINMPDSDKKYYQCIIYVNDIFYKEKPCDSVDSVSIVFPVKSIQLKLCADSRIPGRFLDTLSTNKFTPQSGTSNRTRIDVTLIDSFFNYRVIKNETLKVTRNGIIFYDRRDGRRQFIKRQ
jgi:hypothetical protein